MKARPLRFDAAAWNKTCVLGDRLKSEHSPAETCKWQQRLAHVGSNIHVDRGIVTARSDVQPALVESISAAVDWTSQPKGRQSNGIVACTSSSGCWCRSARLGRLQLGWRARSVCAVRRTLTLTQNDAQRRSGASLAHPWRTLGAGMRVAWALGTAIALPARRRCRRPSRPIPSTSNFGRVAAGRGEHFSSLQFHLDRRVPTDRVPDGVPGAGREPSASLMTNASSAAG
eukprot:scaffold66289_cov75-Phaeocystis_antarctica.AAC.2